MNRSRTLSVSAAPYDGHDFPEVLESLVACGVGLIEPAYFADHAKTFDESAFAGGRARPERGVRSVSHLEIETTLRQSIAFVERLPENSNILEPS